MKHFRIIAPLALLGVSLLIAYPLYAHCGKCAADGKKIVAQLDQNKITLAKAIEAAEKHGMGRAVSVVPLLDDKGALTIQVYCVGSDKIMRHDIDGKTGAVRDMKEVDSFAVAPKEHAAGHEREGAKHDDADHDDHPAGAAMISNRNAEVACGSCIYKMPGVEGCHLAVMLDGKPYLVNGATWPNHDFCDRKLQAVVTGKVEGDKFIASSVKESK
jgi:hypothetical protein